MKILLIGEIYSSNLGDGVICETVAALIKQIYPNSEIVTADISGRSDYEVIDYVDEINHSKEVGKGVNVKKIIYSILSKDEYTRSFLENRNKGKLKYIQELCNEKYDLAIFAGGQMFMNYFVIAISRYVELLSQANVPIIFNACGVGTIKSKKMQKILRESLINKNVKYISTRDDKDYLSNTYLRNSREIYKTFDSALWCAEIYNVKRRESEVVGLGIIYLPKKEAEMISFWKFLIQDLNKKNIKWQFFCNGSIEDYVFAKKLLTLLGIKDDSALASRPEAGYGLVDLISNYKSIISFRLHSHIIACSLGIPGIALVWDKKLNYFFESIGYPERCCTIDYNADIVGKLNIAEIEGYNQEIIDEQKDQILMSLNGSIASTNR